MKFHTTIVVLIGLLGIVLQLDQARAEKESEILHPTQESPAKDPQSTSSSPQGSSETGTKSWFNDAVDSVASAAKNAAANLDEASKNFANVVSNKTESARKTLSEGMETVKNVVGEKSEAAKKTLSEGMETVKNAVNGTFQNIKNAIQTENSNATTTNTTSTDTTST